MPELCVNVSAAGKKAWLFRVAKSGTIVTLRLGSFPAHSIAVAREWASALDEAIERGVVRASKGGSRRPGARYDQNEELELRQAGFAVWEMFLQQIAEDAGVAETLGVPFPRGVRIGAAKVFAGAGLQFSR